MISYDIYLFHYYSLVGLLNKLDTLKVEVKKYHVYKENKYYLKIKRKYRKIIKANFNDFLIEEKIGFINTLEQIITRPAIGVGLLLAVILFVNLSSRIYEIEINGDYPAIENSILNCLYKNNLKVNMIFRDDKIKEIEFNLKENFNNELEFIEITKTGAKINVNYKKRRKAFVVEDKKGSLYATKDGVVASFYLLSGVKQVKVYDYVKKGDLLVSDILLNTKDENVFIGTRGKVFAYTFYYLEVNTNLDLDYPSKQAYLLDVARKKVSVNLNSEEEYIQSENILVNNLEKGYMKIYYVLYEDITI